MKNIKLILAAVLVLATASAAVAQMPKPGVEVKKLDVFAGTWTLQGDLKPGPMGSGATVTENEKCEWMEGRFFLVCHTDFKSSMGNGVGTSVMGYSADDKGYTYREFNSWGEFTDSKGSVDGDTWTWINDEKADGGKMIKGRFTMKMTSSTSYTLHLRDVAGRGEDWTDVAMDGKATKGK